MPYRGQRTTGRLCRWLSLLGMIVVLGACGPGEREGGAAGSPPSDPEAWEGDIEAATRVLRPREGTDRDWEIFQTTVTAAWERGLDTLPIGDTMARIGELFVGWPYEPGTLEVAGEEDVVINLEAFDCVTLVENVFALARFVKLQDRSVLGSEAAARRAFSGTVRELRYRRGRVAGYPSRLHYFSDWIRDNEARGLVREVTQELGGKEDVEVIDFMTSHPDSYRQLADPASFEAVQETERELSGITRYRISQEELSTWISWIQDGDIIAATSTVEGLDVAHTGLAYWQEGQLHLLHAPLVGEEVEISRLPLAERILRLSGQDGIRVVRPLEPVGMTDSSEGTPSSLPQTEGRAVW